MPGDVRGADVEARRAGGQREHAALRTARAADRGVERDDHLGGGPRRRAGPRPGGREHRREGRDEETPSTRASYGGPR